MPKLKNMVTKTIIAIVLTGGGAELKAYQTIVEYIWNGHSYWLSNEHLTGDSDEEFQYCTRNSCWFVMNSIRNNAKSATPKK
jgi:hypothetical protein